MTPNMHTQRSPSKNPCSAASSFSWRSVPCSLHNSLHTFPLHNPWTPQLNIMWLKLFTYSSTAITVFLLLSTDLETCLSSFSSQCSEKNILPVGSFFAQVRGAPAMHQKCFSYLWQPFPVCKWPSPKTNTLVLASNSKKICFFLNTLFALYSTDLHWLSCLTTALIQWVFSPHVCGFRVMF